MKTENQELMTFDIIEHDQLGSSIVEKNITIENVTWDDYYSDEAEDIIEKFLEDYYDENLNGFSTTSFSIQPSGEFSNNNDVEKILSENEAMTKALEALGFTQENISVIKSGEFIPQIVSDEQFKAYAVGLFTCDGENGAKDYDNLMEGKSELSVWQPFEYWPIEDVASEVENTYDSLKQWFAPTLIRSEESEAEDDEYRNTLTCNSCAADIDLCECKRFKYDSEYSDCDKVIVKLLDFQSGEEAPWIEAVILVDTENRATLGLEVHSLSEVLLKWEQNIGEWNEAFELSYEIDGEYLHIHSHNFNEEIKIQIKSQEHDKGLIVDVYINDEECESLGYLLESDFSKITEQWCEQCAMEAKVDEHENCINCGQPTNQKLEKFECKDCGCFFMVADRDDFVCPNCESIEEE